MPLVKYLFSYMKLNARRSFIFICLSLGDYPCFNIETIEKVGVCIVTRKTDTITRQSNCFI